MTYWSSKTRKLFTEYLGALIKLFVQHNYTAARHDNGFITLLNIYAYDYLYKTLNNNDIMQGM